MCTSYSHWRAFLQLALLGAEKRRLTIPQMALASGVRSRVSPRCGFQTAQLTLGTCQPPGWSGIRMKSRGQKEPGFKLPLIS